MKKTLGGAARGKVAVYEWDGNDKAGAERMEITAATPPRGVTMASKLFGLLVNMDNLIGKDFEAGLANLRAVAE